MAFVIDASVVVAWALGEPHELAEQLLVLAPLEQMMAPALWWYELRNVLLIGERRGRISEQQVAHFLRDISRLAIAMDHLPDENDVFRLARAHRLSVYDAAYLELALRNRLPLATLDGMLASAARSEGVRLMGEDPPQTAS